MASSTDDSVQHFGARVLRFTHRVLELVVGLLLSFVYRGPPQHVPAISNMLLLETAESLALKIRKRKVKSEDVVESFIARIKEVNPLINCVVADRFDEALKEAKEVDKFLATSGKSEEQLAAEKPFLGVPFTTKECLEAKGMIFSAGLYARKDVKGAKNADATQCMCDAGAILLATTNTSELAMWWESHNYVHGRSKNPYDTSRIVGGSSGGEGAVLAAAGSPMGLGSDIGGSIRMPAFFNGIFGHKPSKFIVSNEGQYPFPSEEDHASFLGIGPMCRYATDLVPMMKVIAAKNAHKLDLDTKVNVSKLKVYYAEDDGGSVLVSPVNPEIKAAVRRTVMFLEKAHGIKAQKVNMKIMKHSISIWMAKMKSKRGGKFARELNNSDTTPINVWWSLLKWVLCMSRHTFIALCTAITENYGVQYGSPQHQKMVALCDELRIQMLDMLGDDGVFIYPTHPTPAPYHNEPLVKPFNFSYSGIFNVLGLPATHCPMGLNSRGLPIGIQVVAGPNQDKLTLAMAVEFEKAFGGWVPPSVNV